MAKNIFIYRNVIEKLNDKSDLDNIFLHLKNLVNEGNTIYIVTDSSNDNHDLTSYENYDLSFMPTITEEIPKIIDTSENSSVFIDNKNSTYELSQKSISLFITPLWMTDMESKPDSFGIKVKNSKQMYQIIKHSNNNNYWHTKNELEDGSMLFTLIDAKFRYFSTSTNEGKMIDNFLSILHGEEENNFFKILKYDLLSALSNKSDYFDNVDIWTIFPKSNLTLDRNMMELKYNIESNRGLTEKDNYIEDNLIIRHTEKQRSHEIPVITRYSEGAKLNLKTIQLNPKFRDKVKGATVCVIDDFLNHGYSFEAARNLLKAAGAKQVVLVALGLYQNDYSYEEYDIKGDPFTKDFIFGEPIKRKPIQNLRFKVNFQVKVEVETLFSVFN